MNVFKCIFGAGSVEYLRHHLTGDGASLDPRKVEVNLEWSITKTKFEAQLLLGSVGYCTIFLRNGFKISKPLNSPTSNVSFESIKEPTVTFKKLQTSHALPLFSNPSIQIYVPSIPQMLPSTLLVLSWSS